MYFLSNTARFNKTSWQTSRLVIIVCACVSLIFSTQSVSAQGRGPFVYEKPVNFQQQPDLEGVKVDEKLGNYIPLDLILQNEHEVGVKLSSYLKVGKPLLITMNYSTCPLLCSLQLTDMVKVMQELDDVAGRDFQLISISYDPTESPQQAGEIKKRYLSEYGKAADDTAWDFLVGKSGQIKELADALGISYRYFPEKKQYSHPATIVFVTSEGKIARYLHGVGYNKDEFQRAIEDTRAGIISLPNSNNYFPLYCSLFDPNSKSYAAAAMRVMQIGSFLFVLCMGTIFWTLSRMVKYKKQQLAQSSKQLSRPVLHN